VPIHVGSGTPGAGVFNALQQELGREGLAEEARVRGDHLFLDVLHRGDDDDRDGVDRRIAAPLGVGLLPIENLIGRVDTLVVSWDRKVTEQPVWAWPSGLRFARFFTPVR